MGEAITRVTTDSPPLVSAIIIFLNAERFLREAIESVMSQTYGNWELLLVDDGSRDGSSSIAQRYAEGCPEKIRYTEHPGNQNLGMSASRNLGIKHSSGVYIAFLDADDVWLPKKLEEQVAILGSNAAAAMVYGPALLWHGETSDTRRPEPDFIQQLGVRANALARPPMLLNLFLRNEGATPSPSGILVRREIVERVDGFEESFRGMYEDQAFYAKVCLEAPVFVADEVWYKYRQHPDASVSVAVSTGQYRPARLAFLEWLAGYLSERGNDDREVLAAVQKELEPYRHPIPYYLAKVARHPLRYAKRLLRLAAWRVLPLPVRSLLRGLRQRYGHWPPVGRMPLGALRRLQPTSRVFGTDRGRCIDRYYIENFLASHAPDIRGLVLEIGDDTYTRRFGGDRVAKSDVLHFQQGNPGATIVADLTCANHIPSESFDCIILTQTLQFIYDVRAALATISRILKPGGVLLATFPGISQISRYDMDHWGEYWRFTTRSAERLFGEVFTPENVAVDAYGNVLTAVAFLHGLVVEELSQEELDYGDPDYEVLIAVRAVKPAAQS